VLHSEPSPIAAYA
jgi:hypothetical protein